MQTITAKQKETMSVNKGKKLQELAVSALATGLLTLGSAAYASLPPTTCTTGKATGGVSFMQGNNDWKVAFNAQDSYANGPKGQIQAMSNSEEIGRFHGDVTCVCKMGNRMYFSGPAKYRDNSIKLVGFLAVVEDNGEPGVDGTDGYGMPDGIRLRFLQEVPYPNACIPPIPTPSFEPDNPILKGNLQVHEDHVVHETVK